MHKGFLITSFILAAISVMLGAFAAHSLKENLSAENLEVFQTAVRYQFYHVFALMICGILYKEFKGELIKVAGWFFICGIIFFSGSLYALTYVKSLSMWLGPITPIGGLCFIIGWICLVVTVVRKKT